MGRIEIHRLTDAAAGLERTVRIYLPQAYGEGGKRYPVLYMQDGQNVYCDQGAFGNCSWKVKETLERMEREEAMRGLIVAAVDNIGERRYEDYSPWKNTAGKSYFKAGERGGLGDAYVEFLVNTVKPFVDKSFRTLPEGENTGIAGSSMGGLISAYAGAKYAGLFHKVGVFSLASWFAEEPFLDYLEKAELNRKQRIYVSVGTGETSDPENARMPQIYLDNSRHYVWKLLEKGISAKQILFEIGAGETHSEKCWAGRFEKFIEFMYGV